ncbi:hypothetical protein KCU77_g331, partial [Aureobasidium melanogenum]
MSPHMSRHDSITMSLDDDDSPRPIETTKFEPAGDIKNILITGGAGFIGGWITRHMTLQYLEYNIVCFDKLDEVASLANIQCLKNCANFEFVLGNLTDQVAVSKVLVEHDIDTIMHLARLLDTVRHLSKKKQVRRFVHISTDEVCGDAKIEFVDETHILTPTNPYSASKAAAEMKLAAVLDLIPLIGMDITTRSVAEAPQTIRLINTGVHSKIVLRTETDSAMKIVLPPKHNYWANEDVTYLVAGGLDDIGQRILTIMAARGIKHVATLSRDPKSHVQCELHSGLEAIQPGIKLYALKGNVSSKASIQAAAASLAQQGAPPVRGVIMAATYINNRPLELLTFEDYLSVAKIKVDGTPALYQAFASDDLRFFLSLSSVASIIGAQAEASYNAGNTIQDSLAHQEKQYGSGGTPGDDTRQGAMDRAGFAKIKQETCFSQAVIGFDADFLSKSTFPNSNIQSSMFNEVRDRRPAVTTNESDENATGRTYDEVVADGDIEEITDHISQATRTHLARLISLDLENIEVRQGSILALGLDSLVAVKLRNWVMRQFDAPLQSMEILANQTIHVLAEKIIRRSKKIAAVA